MNKSKYADLKPIGGCHISNDSGIVIFEVNDDFVIAGLSVGSNPVSEIRKRKIFWDDIDESGETSPYFNFKGVKFHLSDCIRF